MKSVLIFCFTVFYPKRTVGKKIHVRIIIVDVER